MESETESLKNRLIHMESTIKELTNSTDEVKWLDDVDVKKLLNCSASTLARYRNKNTIPYIKLGGKYLYPASFFTKSLLKKVVNAHLL